MIPRLFYNRIFLFFLALCILAAGWFFLSEKAPGAIQMASWFEDKSEQTELGDNPEIDGNVISHSSRDGWLLYHDSTLPFSFEFPAIFIPKAYADEAGDVLVFESSPDSATNQGFQIFITNIGEEIAVITPDRIREDLPDVIIKEPQEIVLGNGSADSPHALMFFSDDPTLGKTREVWITHNMMLYQITARAELDTLLAEIMKTWKFLQ